MKEFLSMQKLISISVFLFSVVFAGANVLITPAEAADTAVKHCLSLKQKNISILQKKLKVIESLDEFIPQFGICGSFSRSNLSDKDRTTTYEELLPNLSSATTNGYDEVIPNSFDVTKPRWSVNFTAYSVWEFNVSSILSLCSKLNLLKQNKLSFELAENEIRKTALSGCAAVFYHKAKNVVTNEHAELTKQFCNMLALCDDRLEKYRTIYSELKKNELQQEVDETENLYEKSLMFLNFLLGKENIYFSGELEDFHNESFFDEKTCSEYREEEFSLRQKELKLNIAEEIAHFIPSLQVNYLFSPSYTRNPWLGDWFENSGKYWNDKFGSLNFVVKMPLNFSLPFSKQQLRLCDLRKEQKKLQYEIQEHQEIKEYRKALHTKQIQNYRKKIRTLEAYEKLSEEEYREVTEAFQKGLIEVYEIKNAIERIIEARKKTLDTKYEFAVYQINFFYGEEM